MPSVKGPVKVFAKIRPILSEETRKSSLPMVQCKGSSLVVSVNSKEQVVAFDGAFNDQQSNNSMFDSFGESCTTMLMDGLNCCFVAFGASGCGKSFVLDGNNDDLGLAFLMIDSLYLKVASLSGKKKFLVTASCLQIGEDKLTDLLNPHNRGLTAVIHPRMGVVVKGLSEFVVNSSDELKSLYNQASAAKEGTKNARQRQTTIFNIGLHQKSEGEKMGVRSRLQLVDLGGIDGNLVKDPSTSKSVSALCQVVKALAEGKKRPEFPSGDDKLVKVLQDAIGGNCVTFACACLAPTQSSLDDTSAALLVSEQLRKVKNSADVVVDESDYLVSELRQEIAKMREKILGRTPTKQDIFRFEEMVSDLELVKKETWTEKIRATATLEEERRLNLAKVGMTSSLKPREADNRNLNQRLTQLKQEKKQIALEYKEKGARIEALKDDVRKKIVDFMKAAEAGKLSESDEKQRVAAIEESKKRLSQEAAGLRTLRTREAQLDGEIEREKAAAVSESVHLLANIEARRAADIRLRDQTRADQQRLLAEEADRGSLDVEQKRAEMQNQTAQGRDFSSEEARNMALQLAQMQVDKQVVALKVQLLQEELEATEKSLNDLYDRCKTDVEKIQAANFQIFREFRETFDRQKLEIETRYRALVEDSVKDAVFLSGRNTELMQENTDLRQEIAKLKDQLSTGPTGAGPPKDDKKK